MISLILGGFCFAIILYNCYTFVFERPPNFPPGPPKVPFFGSYIFMLLLNHKHLQFAVDRICAFYKTTLLGIHMGPYPTIVINDLKTLKKALNHRDFDGRPDFELTKLRHPSFKSDLGILFRQGESWLEQRRFALRYLRDFGFGRRFETLEKEIEIQLRQFIDIVKNGPKFEHEKKYMRRGRILMPYAFGPTVENCFLACLLNEPVARENMADLYSAVENGFKFQRNADSYARLFSTIPAYRKWFPEWSGYNVLRESSIQFFDIFKKIVDEEIRTFDPSHERHFVDMYVNKMRHQDSHPEEKTYFTRKSNKFDARRPPSNVMKFYEQLIATCSDFSLATVTTVPATLSLLFQQLCLEPVVQQKVQQEIDHVVGQGRPPTLSDRINLPYTEACIREIMRFETLVPSGVPHQAMVDTEFEGFTIPKGTVIVPALRACLHDPTAFDIPEKFHPERFLDSSGKLCLKKDISLPFGAGKRLCAGETFSRNIMFLCTTAFLQAFSVRMADGARPLRFDQNLTGLLRMPIDHWLEVTAR